MTGYPQLPGFQAGSETSEAAAKDVAKSGNEKRECLLKYFQCQMGKGLGMTIDEAAQHLSKEFKENVQTGTASARIRELELMGIIVKSTMTRTTRARKRAKVYFLKGCVPEGHEVNEPSG